MPKLKYLFNIILFLSYVIFWGCSNEDISDPREEDNKNDIEYPAGIEELMSAFDHGKTISNIMFIPASSFAGDPGARWLVTFTDASSINVFNPEDFSVPYIRVNNEGVWSIALDGINFKNIIDNSGESIQALAADTDPESPLQNEVDLICISPVVDKSGDIYLEVYNNSDQSQTIDYIKTPMAAPTEGGLISVVQNDYEGTISFYITGHDSLRFSYKNRWPYSFGIVSSEEPLFNSPGDTASVEFFVTPSDIDFRLDTEEPLLDLRLVYLNGSDAINYSSYPVGIKDITKVTDEEGKTIPGRYKLNLTDAGDNLFAYDEPVSLSLFYLGVERENLSISSESFNVRYNSESPLIIRSEIPVIKITSPSSISSKDIWTENCDIEILNAGEYSKSYSKVSIKGRGNSTWELPKKPYAIKLDKKDEMLGFPKHKRWVLLANYYDKTNLRNEIAFYLGRMSARQSEPGMDYTPRSSFARIIFNDKFKGLYQLTEQLKIDENRVNTGDDGYLLEIDFRAPEEPENIYFRIPHIDNYIVIKDPDIENQEDLNYIKDFMTKVDRALFADNFTDPQEGYRKYLDVNSFVDWYLVNEITKNADGNFWASCYMNFSRGGKLKMGPIWDYDLGYGNYQNFGDWWYTQWVNTPQDFHIKNVKWYERLFEDQEFVKTVKRRFQYYYDHQNDIYAEIETQKKLIYDVIEENEKIWFLFSSPYDSTISYKAFNASCDEFQGWLRQRFQWLKTQFDKL